MQYRCICDRCGFEFWSHELKLQWNGLRVCPEDFEKRNAQDFVRAVKPDRYPYGSKPVGEYLFVDPAATTPDDL